MKIAITYPPIEQDKGVPLLSQNRQFQYFNSPTYIYPMVPAFAATLAKEAGHEVVWMDGIAEQWSYEEFCTRLNEENPRLILIETKTPTVKIHWKIVDDLKKRFPETLVVLVGDHVTVFPEETMQSCNVDYVITGGDYDFILLDLLGALEKGSDLPSGVWGRVSDRNLTSTPDPIEDCDYWTTGKPDLKHDISNLPFIDRDLTKWKLYAYENGNYKYKPGTYVYSGRDCWWNKCTFCVWDHVLYPPGSYRGFTAERLFDEVKHVVDNYGVKEVFDDAGTLFVGPKLKKFCKLLIDSGYNKKVTFSCNMRINALNKETAELMAEAGFRFILYGLESGNQSTLDRINKGLKVEEIEPGLKIAKEAGLEPHVTVMLGYPWESEEMAQTTIDLAKDLFKKGYIDTMQATIVIPYPGTPLYNECVENDWLLFDPKDYEKFDMRGPVMKTPFSRDRLMEMTQELYKSFMSPQFIVRKILSIRSLDDVKFFVMAGKKLLGHLMDFGK